MCVHYNELRDSLTVTFFGLRSFHKIGVDGLCSLTFILLIWMDAVKYFIIIYFVGECQHNRFLLIVNLYGVFDLLLFNFYF